MAKTTNNNIFKLNSETFYECIVSNEAFGSKQILWVNEVYIQKFSCLKITKTGRVREL